MDTEEYRHDQTRSRPGLDRISKRAGEELRRTRCGCLRKEERISLRMS